MERAHQRKYSQPTYFCQYMKEGSSLFLWNNLDVKLGKSGSPSSRAFTNISARNGLAQLFSKSFPVLFSQHLSVS